MDNHESQEFLSEAQKKFGPLAGVRVISIPFDLLFPIWHLLLIIHNGSLVVHSKLMMSLSLGSLPVRDREDLFAALSRSPFRRRFRLRGKELLYLQERGIETMLEHARQFITARLAPADPANDGKQTPMRNHPVFVAQHATATCCRGCLEKWHHIPKGRPLSPSEIDYIISVIEHWLTSASSVEPRLEGTL